MQRQQKDHDIARMNALTNAVQFLSAFQDKLEAETELSDLALKVAGKFYTWIMDGKPDPVKDAVDYVKEELEAEPGKDAPRYRRKNTYQDREAGGTVWGDAPSEEYRKEYGPYGGLPLSKKQRGYIIGLHKRLGQEPDFDQIDQLTTEDASNYIDDLKAMLGEGKGNGKIAGKDILRTVKEQIKDSGISHTLVS